MKALGGFLAAATYLLVLRAAPAVAADPGVGDDGGRGLISTLSAYLFILLETARNVFSTPLFEINDKAVTLTGFVIFFLILAGAWVFSAWARRALLEFSRKYRGVSVSSVFTFTRVFHYLVVFTGFLIALSSLGINLSDFTIIAGALGVGIGFGLQNMVNNFISGLVLLFEKTLKRGDFVELESGVFGEVQSINMRSTVITTPDNVDIVVPNGEFISGRVTNWTMRETVRRMHIPFGVAYGSPLEVVRDAALEAADRVDYTLTGFTGREPQAWLVEFGDSSLNFELVVWIKADAVKSPARIKAVYLWEIHQVLVGRGIAIPFPQRDIHVKSGLDGIFGKDGERGRKHP